MNRGRNATAKNPFGEVELSDKAKHALKKILLCISKKEQ